MFAIMALIKMIDLMIRLTGGAVQLVCDLLGRYQPPPFSENIKGIQSKVPSGVVFGKKRWKHIVKPESADGHVLVVGGVGSGKSSCIAIPTLRAWGESVFAIDIKGELYDRSNQSRASVKVFSPLDNLSCGYDPYYCLHSSTNQAQEARAIAQAIIPVPPDTREPFWIESAQNLFTAAILHYSKQGLSFLDTIRKIQRTPSKDLIKEISADANAGLFVRMIASISRREMPQACAFA